ncbi:MAG: PIN domain-containing protein [Thermodesulfobacteriota bacterium]
MTDPLSETFSRYRHKGLMVDSNLLLLLVVGACDPKRIPTFERTKMFTTEDYELMAHTAGYFDHVITTPCVLTEVSNLLGQLGGNLHGRFFSRFAETIHLLREEYAPSTQLAGRDDFSRFGLTDSSIIHCVKGRYLVITVDFPLSGHLWEMGVDVVNFNQILLLHWRL